MQQNRSSHNIENEIEIFLFFALISGFYFVICEAKEREREWLSKSETEIGTTEENSLIKNLMCLVHYASED